MVILKTTLLSCLFALNCLAEETLETGFYSGNSDGIEKISKIIDDADRELFFDRDGKFTLGLGEFKNNAINLISFEFNQISRFLFKEKHKKLLVIWIEKDLMAINPENRHKRIQELKKNIETLMYERYVILGASGAGIHYLYDSKAKAKTKGP